MLIGLFEHVGGFLGTSLGVQILRHGVVFYYPESIDLRACGATNHPYGPAVVGYGTAEVRAPWIDWLSLGLGWLGDEAWFQSDLVSSCFSQLALAAAVAGLLGPRPLLAAPKSAATKIDLFRAPESAAAFVVG